MATLRPSILRNVLQGAVTICGVGVRSYRNNETDGFFLVLCRLLGHRERERLIQGLIDCLVLIQSCAHVE